jgi:nucleoside-diphosphate-sugar epimerase
MYRRIPAIEKVRSLIGWSPAHSLEDIIREVAEHGRTTERV